MSDPNDEEAVARLLQLAGQRPEAPADRAERVRQAVMGEWAAATRQRRQRRLFAGTGAAMAIAAVILVALRLGMPGETPVVAPPVVATIERIDGTGATLIDSTVPVRAGVELRAGASLDTGTGRVALRGAAGVSLRLDRGSRVRLVSIDVVELDRGAVYVDSGLDAPPLEIRTPLGVVRDVGTQFEARLEDGRLRVRVRSGLVEWHRGSEMAAARPGTELRVDDVQATTHAIAPYGDEWAWAANLAPAFGTDGRPLGAFVDHLAREQGWAVGYAEPRLAAEVSGIIIHGSVDELAPRDALTVVLSTSGLGYRLEQGELQIFRLPRP